MNETNDAAAILAPLWKWKWLILLVTIVAGGGTYFYYRHQPAVYGASTQIYLGQGSQAQAQLNSQATTINIPDQAALINSSVIADPVQQKLRREKKFDAAAGFAQATAATTSDFIIIDTQARTAQAAADLANAYAQVYLSEHNTTYKANLEAVLASLRSHLYSVEHSSHSATQSLQVQELVTEIDQFDLQLSLGDAGDQQLNPAVAGGVPLSPKPTRNAIFGAALGFVLAAIAAYGLSRFDRKLRTLADIEAVFRVPVLTVLPSVRRPITRRGGQPLPAEALREPLRSLHTNLQLRAMIDETDGDSPRSVLLVSADAGDGKSTLAASLALVQSEAGEVVALVEADLRRPAQAGLLGIDGSRGLVDVLSGTMAVREAMQVVTAAEVPTRARGRRRGNGAATVVQSSHGSVSVLASGGTVANPPALLAGPGMPALLRTVADHFDQVLIDAPPPLQVSDALPLLTLADGIVLVARIGHTVDTSAQRLVEMLSRSPHAPVLGIVVTDAKPADIEAFGVTSAYEDVRWRRQ